METQIVSILVHNRSGVLMRITGLFSRRSYNIESLAVGAMPDPNLSRITVTLTCDERTLDQVIQQLLKQPCVVTVKHLPAGSSVSRELILVKVRVTPEKRGEIMQLANVFRARIVDVGRDMMTFELTGEYDKTEAFLNLISDEGIIEIARTGMISLARGNDNIFD